MKINRSLNENFLVTSKIASLVICYTFNFISFSKNSTVCQVYIYIYISREYPSVVLEIKLLLLLQHSEY